MCISVVPDVCDFLIFRNSAEITFAEHRLGVSMRHTWLIIAFKKLWYLILAWVTIADAVYWFKKESLSKGHVSRGVHLRMEELSACKFLVLVYNGRYYYRIKLLYGLFPKVHQQSSSSDNWLCLILSGIASVIWTKPRLWVLKCFKKKASLWTRSIFSPVYEVTHVFIISHCFP